MDTVTRPKTLQELLRRALQERNPTPDRYRWFEREMSRLVLRELSVWRDTMGGKPS